MELKILKSDAVKAYKEADCNGKKLLANLFGSETFKRKEGKEIKTLEDACEATGTCIEGLSFADKLFVIIRAINGDWTPDWSNSSEWKYYPWFNMGSGGFSFTYVFRTGTNSHVGSRLVFKSRELAEYAAKQFLPYYKEFMTL